MRNSAALTFGLIAAMTVIVGARQAAPAQAPAAGDGVEVLKVQDDVYMVAGGGGNVTFHVGEQGLTVVDTGSAAGAERIHTAIRTISKGPIRYVINTTDDADHTGGNEFIGAKMGLAIPGRNLSVRGAIMVAHENVLNRMTAAGTPSVSWPSDIFFTAQKDLYLNNTAIQIMHQPSAHSDGDVFVYFRRADVVAAGDVMRTTGYPVIDAARGGSIKGTVDALNRLLDIIVAGEKGEGGTMVVPGHGHVSDEAEVVEYRDMVTIIRDRVQDAINKGQTLPQIQAARLTFEYDGLYGSDPRWTPQQFIEAIHKTLTPTAPRTATNR